MISKKKLWQAQLVFWPDSVRLTVYEVFEWCEAGANTAEKMSRYMQMSSALRSPNVVFYRIEGTEYRGFRYGLHGAEYVSMYS